MTNLDTPAELQERLRELPTELEAFFRLILDATEKVYHKQAARIYQIARTAENGLYPIDLAWFNETDPQYSLSDNELVVHHSELAMLSEETIIRVKARCQDLLEFSGAKIQFLHRTVKDFLDTKDIAVELNKRAGNDFNPHRFLCNSMLLQMKIKARLKKPTLIHVGPFYRMLDTFSIHARYLDESGKLDLGLLAEIDRSACSFLKRLDRTHIRNEYSIEAAWLVTRLHQANIDSNLSKSTSTTVKVKQAGIAAYLSKEEVPLVIALIHMKPSEERFAKVKQLLLDGHDPNHPSGRDLGRSTWKEHMVKVESWSMAGRPIVHTEKKIIQALLNHGADPGVLTKAGLLQTLRIYAGEEFCEELVALARHPHQARPRRELTESRKAAPGLNDRLTSPEESTSIVVETKLSLRNKRKSPFIKQNDSESPSDAGHEDELSPRSAISKRVRVR